VLPDGQELVLFGDSATCDAYAFQLAEHLQLVDGQGALSLRSDTCEVFDLAVVTSPEARATLAVDDVLSLQIKVLAIDGDSLTASQTTRVAAADGPACVGGQGDLDEPAMAVSLVYRRLDADSSAALRCPLP
jgi:hypothetical protein